jgi:Protein of unknown function (DUF1501)
MLVFLTGGPPQLDTFDTKPHAPAEVRGELKPISTTVPGIHVSELFPNLANQADKFCIVRSVSHSDTVHTSAGYTMLTGVKHPLANARTAADIRATANDHPHIGSLLSKLRPERAGIPTFASLPEYIRDAGVNDYPGQDAGFLGKQFGPFQIHADTAKGTFPLPDIVLPPDISAERLADRSVLLNQLDHAAREVDARASAAGLDAFYRQAYSLIRSPTVREALTLDREPEAVRNAYGHHLFGQGCLLARRLLEAEVALVTVYWHYEGPDDSPVWDTHWNNFPHLRTRLAPPADQAIARLIDDLANRSLLDDTLVLVMGEFGRTPKINRYGGRDHWPHVQSILIAGAGIRGGSVYGSSDKIAAHPADSPVSPADLAATILHLLGVPLDIELHDRTGRLTRVCDGSPIRGLIGTT